ncbi:MAG: SDR family oxidoreductase [Holophagales bacterium]|nr:SDR family oxidoreductase [Holophagales bacterium]
MSRLTGEPLDGQVVAILGGAGRMGGATAREVSALGGHPVLVGRNPARLSEAAGLLPGAASTLVADVGTTEELRDALHEAGRLDHIVVAISAEASASSIAVTDSTVARRAFGRFWVSYDTLQLALSILPGNGSVTLISGSSARTPAPGYGVWTTLHGSIEALARAASIDIAPIRVNVVSPGGIGLTPDRQLVERRAEASDIGVAIVALIVNSAITGAVLDVDSGERKGTWSG